MTKDEEETAQWLSAPATIRAVLEACLGKVSSIKGQVLLIHHYTTYDGNFERVPLLMICVLNMSNRTFRV